MEVGNVIIGGMQEHQSIKTDGICTCLTSSMGTGGGYVPMIIDIRKVDIVNEQNTMPSRAEQSRAEQSRAEQLNGCIRLGNVYNDQKFDGGNFGGNVWDVKGLAPTMKTGASASQQCTVEVKKMEKIICAMRGRDKENPNHRGPANENYEQVLEVNNSGISNTLTSVTKDNLVLIVDDLYENREKRVYENVSPTLRGERNGLKTIKIRQATKEGFIDCGIPGVADLNYADSKTRRGRVVEGGQISPTLTTENIPSVIELGDPGFYNFLYEIDGEIYLIRIRKLIPKECLALMDVDEEYIERMLEVESNTNLYKAAGNSIVVNCLTAIFGMMFEGKEDVYKSYC